MKRLSPALLGAALCLAAGGAWAQQSLSADAVAKRIAEAHNVEVLRVEPADADGRAAYVVTVMNRGGAFNEAFKVTRLMVDAATGALISQFRHGPTGYGGTANPNIESDGVSIRRRSLSR